MQFTMKNHCEIEHVYGPLFLIAAYTLLAPYAIYVILQKPLTYHVSTFTILALVVILYTIRITVFPSQCPSKVGTYIPGDEHPDIRVQSPLPPVATHPPSPSYANPRSFYGELGSVGGKRNAPFTSNRGYAHYISQPV